MKIRNKSRQLALALAQAQGPPKRHCHQACRRDPKLIDHLVYQRDLNRAVLTDPVHRHIALRLTRIVEIPAR